MKNYWHHIKCFLLAIGTSYGLMMEITLDKYVVKSRLNNDSFALLLVGLLFFWFYEKFLKKEKRNRVFQVLSLLFSSLLVVGYSYDVVGNALLVDKNIYFFLLSFVKFVSFYHLFYLGISFVYQWITTYKMKEKVTKSKIIRTFMNHPFLCSFLVIFICYLPYLIAYYPGIMCNDPTNQIKEVMGIHTRYMDSVILRDPNMTITNFNPVLHTLLIGGCFKFGYTLGSVNFGIFIYVLIQMFIMIATFSFAISYMKKAGVPKIFLILTLLIVALVPAFPYYAIATNKDTIFSSFILLYILMIYDIIKNGGSKKKYIFLFIVSLLVILSRNNGIYTILLSLPFLLIAEKEKRKSILVVLVGLIACYIGYGKVLLPSLGISDTSIREMLSIPFQQTARVVKYHKEEIPTQERDIIDKILGFDDLGERYNPSLADDVKDRYNKYATKEDLKAYFQVWFQQFFRYPVNYLDATISNVYGYFYPNTSKWYIYTDYNTRLKEAGFDYHFVTPEWMREKLTDFGEYYPYIPILGMIVNIGFVVWIYFLLFGYLLVNQKGRYLPVLLPAFSLILVCVASPANTYFRYAQPYIFALPFTVFLLYQIITKEKKKYEKK